MSFIETNRTSAGLEQCDRELIQRYNHPAPRYTSYPTALQFDHNLAAESLLAACPVTDEAISVYVHLPFCESLCWYCGCNTVITRDHAGVDGYLDALERELTAYQSHWGCRRTVCQVHLGGGTPNYLDPGQLRRLADMLRANFEILDVAECGIELDPRVLSREQVEVLAEVGFNRASFGVQDCNPAVQAAIHRIQPHELNERAMQWLRDAQFQSINIDLIYGLPLQSATSFRQTLESVLTLQPDRLAVFSYAHVPWVKPAQKALERKQLPAAEEKLAMFLETLSYLADQGYDHIGLDHFARADDDLAIAARAGTLRRNFQGYTTFSGDEVAGFGLSAISQTRNSHRQNFKEIDAYYAAIQAGRFPIERGLISSADDMMRADLIQRLMCQFVIDMEGWSNRWGMRFEETFATELERLASFEADGLLYRRSGGFTVSPLGRLLVRNIAMVFDIYANPAPNRHARAI